VYEARFQPVEAGAKEDGVVRIWMQLGADHHGDTAAQAHDDGGIRPAAIDLLDAGGRHFHAQDTSAAFSHSRTNDHDQPLGPVTVPVPAVAGQTAGLGYAGFARGFRLGPSPSFVLDAAWDHV
jgi:hypothetical protein